LRSPASGGLSASSLRIIKRYNVFIMQVLKAWIDPSKRNPRTIHHRGRDVFMVAGRTITLPSRMK